MKRSYLFLTIILMIFSIILNSCSTQEAVLERSGVIEEVKADYPVAMKKPSEAKVHDCYILDNYSWMKDKERKNKKILDHINEENKYAKIKLRKLSTLKTKLYDEIVGRVDQADVSVPVKLGDYLHYSRDIEGKQYPIYCRKLDKIDAVEEILLDLNELSKQHQFLELGTYKLSPDHRFLAYTLDTSGKEHYTLYVKYLKYGKIMPEVIERVDGVEWSNDSRNIYYSTTNKENERTDKVFRHTIGTKVNEDKLLYKEDDPSFNVWVNKTKNKKYLLIGTANKTTSEMRYLSTDTPLGSFTMVFPRKKGTEYYLEHHDNKFYILTNGKRAKNFKIMTADELTPYTGKWKEFFPHRSNVYLEDYELFENYFIVSEISNGKRTIRVLDYESLEGKEIS